MAAKSINIPVTGSTAPLRKSLTKAEKDIQKFAAKAVSDAKTAARDFGIALGAVGFGAKKLVDGASDLQESISKASATFSQNQKAVMEWSKTTADGIGVSQKAALEAASTYGAMFQTLGVGQGEAVEMSKRMVQLAADMASFNNTSIDEAITALRSGLAGEAEPLKRFNVFLSDARLRQEALAMKIYDGTGALDSQTRMLAAYNLILKDSSLQHGDFARTSDGVANKTKIMEANFKDTADNLGMALIPMFDAFLTVGLQFSSWAGQNTVLVAGLSTVLLGSVVAWKAVTTAITVTSVLMVKLPAILAIVKGAWIAFKAAALAAAGGNWALAASNLAVQASTVVGIATATAAAVAIGALTAKVMASASEMDNYAASMAGASAEARGLAGAVELPMRQLAIVDQMLAAEADKRKAAANSAAQAERGRFNQLKDNLKQTKQALRDYIATISDAINREVSLARAFSDSATQRQNAEEAVTDALRERSAAYDALDQARATRDQNDYNEALKRVAEAEAAVTKAQDVKPKDYSAIFAEQIAAAKAFAGYVKQLVQNGLGRAGLAQILELGPVAGAQVAKDLLAGTGGVTIGGLNTDLAAIAAEGTAAGMAIPGMSEALSAKAGRSGPDQYFITVQTGVGDKNEIGRQVVEILQQYNKRVGALPIKVKK
jgi:hypothetical protein